jgi:D-alanyl-D-alanine carboxypeptidase
MIRTPQGSHTVAVGTTELDKQTPPDADTHFRIASCSKTMTAADLLKMRSGLYNYADAPGFSKALDADRAKVWTPQEVLAIAFAHPPNAAPNTAYEYDNTNYALLGLIAEKAGGRPLAVQLHDRLFGPLGLQQTSLPAVDDTAIPAPYLPRLPVRGHVKCGWSTILYPDDLKTAAKAGTLKPTDYTNQNPSYAHAAGGAISTAGDIETWIRSLVSG